MNIEDEKGKMQQSLRLFFIKISLGTLTYNLEYYNIFTKVTI